MFFILDGAMLLVILVIVAVFFAMEGSVLERIVDTILFSFMCYLMLNMIIIGGSGMFQSIINTLIFDIFFLALLWFAPLLIAPQKALVKRLSYLLIGLAVVYGLNEASKQVERLRAAANPAAATQQR
jgi:hypothetical protein